MKNFSKAWGAVIAGLAVAAGAATVVMDSPKDVQAAEARALTPGQAATQQWMKDTAMSKVKEQNWTTVSFNRANLDTLDAFGACTRRMPNGTTLAKTWRVKFVVVGSGSTRHLEAQTPIYM